MLKILSQVGLLIMAAALIGLYKVGSLLSWNPVAIALQIVAVGLMGWARWTFKWRSFHASADPTAGGLVTTGPYRFIRHPIYTAACLFGWAGVVVHWSTLSVVLGAALIVGSLIRMLCEERLVMQRYPQYRDYARGTWRMIPYVF